MSVELWTILWKVALIASVILFSGMAIWVSIGGAFEVKQMLSRLGKKDEDS